MTHRRLHIPTAVATAVTVAAAANVLQFPALEAETVEQYEALSIYDGHDVVSLVEGHFGSTRERFGLYVLLGELAPRATVVIPPGTGLSVEQFYGLGGAATVHVEVYEAEVAAGEARALDRNTVASGESREVGPFAITLAEGTASRVVLVTHGGITYLADARLLHDDAFGAGS